MSGTDGSEPPRRKKLSTSTAPVTVRMSALTDHRTLRLLNIPLTLASGNALRSQSLHRHDSITAPLPRFWEPISRKFSFPFHFALLKLRIV